MTHAYRSQDMRRSIFQFLQKKAKKIKKKKNTPTNDGWAMDESLVPFLTCFFVCFQMVLF